MTRTVQGEIHLLMLSLKPLKTPLLRHAERKENVMSRSQMNLIAQNILDSITAEQRRQEILAGKVYPCSPWEGLVGECGKCQSCLDAAKQRLAARKKIWNKKDPICHYEAKEAFEVDWSYEWGCSKAFRDPQGRIVFEMEHVQKHVPKRYMRFLSPDVEDYEIYSIISSTFCGEPVLIRLDRDSRNDHYEKKLWEEEAQRKYVFEGVEIYPCA